MDPSLNPLGGKANAVANFEDARPGALRVVLASSLYLIGAAVVGRLFLAGAAVSAVLVAGGDGFCGGAGAGRRTGVAAGWLGDGGGVKHRRSVGACWSVLVRVQEGDEVGGVCVGWPAVMVARVGGFGRA